MSKIKDRLVKTTIDKTKLISKKFNIDGEEVTYYFKRFTLGARDAWELSLNEARKNNQRQNFRCKLLQVTLVEADGSPVFAHANELLELDGIIIEPLFEECLEIQGISKKTVEDKEKN